MACVIPSQGADASNPKRLTIACSVCDEKFMKEQREVIAGNLRKLGMVQGRDVEIVYCHLESEVPSGEQLRRLMAQVVSTRPDVFFPMDLYSVIAARSEVRDIPTVFSVFDPVGLGIVDQLARPGGNMTGFARSIENLDIKRLKLLREIVPRARRIGVLTQGNYPALVRQFEGLKAAAAAMKVEIREYAAAQGRTVGGDADDLFARMTRDRVDAFLLADGNAWSRRVTELAARHRLPTVYPYGNTTRAGGLASFSATAAGVGDGMQTAGYIVKLLQGTKPSDLPVVAPDEYNLVVNVKAAREAAIAIPPAFLLKATRVIE